MMNTQGETLPLAQRRYQEWLQSKQVHSSDLVSTTNDTNLVVAGWGCVAKSDIKEGTVLFSIPRAACFGAAALEEEDDDSCSVDDDPTTRDDQMDMAISILRCQKQDHDGSNKIEAEELEDWSPFLNILTHPPCLPWTWPSQFRQALLRGTELELVVENKVEHIRIEYEQVAKQQKDLSITFHEYINACAIVSSHTNPWFGVSIVPFNTTLNWGKAPNVEFDLENEEDPRIIGRATCNIKKGQELFQAYGTSVADSIYRYGFADCNGMEGDVVSIDLADILSIVAERKTGKKHNINSESLNLKMRLQVGSEESDNQFAPFTNISHLSSRLDALRMAGALDESPWDGMQGHVTAEVGRASEMFLKSHRSNTENQSKRNRENDTILKNMGMEDRLAYDDGGLSKLVGIFLVLLADEAAWERTSIALQHLGSDSNESRTTDDERDSSDNDDEKDDNHSETSDESRTDDIAASIILASIFHLQPHQAEELLQVALHIGVDGNDPWKALLDKLSHFACHSENEWRPKKRKTLHHQHDKNDSSKAKDRTATAPRSSSLVAQLRSAFVAAKTALHTRREKLLEGETYCQGVISDIEANKCEVNEEFNATAQEAFKTVKIIRDVEKLILDQAVEIVEDNL